MVVGGPTLKEGRGEAKEARGKAGKTNFVDLSRLYGGRAGGGRKSRSGGWQRGNRETREWGVSSGWGGGVPRTIEKVALVSWGREKFHAGRWQRERKTTWKR